MLHFVHKQHLPAIHWENVKEWDRQREKKAKGKNAFFQAIKPCSQSYTCKVNSTTGFISAALTLCTPFHFNGSCLRFTLPGFAMPRTKFAAASQSKHPALFSGANLYPQACWSMPLYGLEALSSVPAELGLAADTCEACQTPTAFSCLQRGTAMLWESVEYPS